MSPEEKELTKRRIAKRNAQRLKKLRGGWSAATIRRRALAVMENEMEYRRRVSGDKTYLRKQAEKTLTTLSTRRRNAGSSSAAGP